MATVPDALPDDGAGNPSGDPADRTGRVRVLHVITWMDLGGAQDHLLCLVNGLDPDRYDITVAAGTSAGARGDLFDALDDPVRVVALDHLRREVSPLHDLAAVGEVGRLMDRFRPDIVHTHSSKAGVIGRLAARRRPVRTVHNVHGWSFRAATNPTMHRAAVHLERLLGARTDVLLTVSDADRDTGEALGIRARVATEVVRGGIDLDAFRAARTGRRGRTHSATGPLVGTVGRLVPAKDPLTAVRAIGLLGPEHPGLRFRWVGDGPLRADVEREVDEAGLGDRVELVGSRHDIARELGEFDLFVLSSRFEGLPRTLMEATAAGVPVVATDVGGVGELVRHGDTGLLVEPGNPTALAEAIHAALEDPDGARDRAERAARGAEDHSVDEMCRRTAQVYERLAR